GINPAQRLLQQFLTGGPTGLQGRKGRPPSQEMAEMRFGLFLPGRLQGAQQPVLQSVAFQFFLTACGESFRINFRLIRVAAAPLIDELLTESIDHLFCQRLAWQAAAVQSERPQDHVVSGPVGSTVADAAVLVKEAPRRGSALEIEV